MSKAARDSRPAFTHSFCNYDRQSSEGCGHSKQKQRKPNSQDHNQAQGPWPSGYNGGSGRAVHWFVSIGQLSERAHNIAWSRITSFVRAL